MKNFGKYIFETLAIFIGILYPSVLTDVQEKTRVEETKKSVLTLVKEIETIYTTVKTT